MLSTVKYYHDIYLALVLVIVCAMLDRQSILINLIYLCGVLM